MPRWKRWALLIGGGLCIVGMVVFSVNGYSAGDAAVAQLLRHDRDLKAGQIEILSVAPRRSGGRYETVLVCGTVTNRPGSLFAATVSKRRSGFLYRGLDLAVSWMEETPYGRDLLTACERQARPL
ncbi:hypothetical protein [Brevundimonas sp.]